MKIALLEKREDFKKVFLETLLKFTKNNPDYLDNDFTSVHLRYNRHLNIVYPTRFPKNDLWTLVQDYRFNKSIIKLQLQRLYVWLAIKTPLERLLSPHLAKLNEIPCSMKRCAFIPGTHSIRIVDFEKNTCYVVAKLGSFPNFLDSDVHGRKKIKIAPKIISFDPSIRFFSETKISGISIDRILDKSKAEETYSKVKHFMRDFYRESSEEVLFSDYLNILQIQFNEVMENLSAHFDNSFVKNISKINETSVKLANECKTRNVYVCRSHGDFQLGNILIENKDIWLIDWEYSAKRSFFFDAIVAECETRKVYGLGSRLILFYRLICSKNDTLSWTGKVLDVNNKVYFFLFLIEELILLMREVSATYIIDPATIIRPRISELEFFLNKYNSN